MPQALEVTEATPWQEGHPLAATEEHVIVADTDNGDLVVLNRETLEVARRVHLGYRPERLVVGPGGTAWVVLRHGGEVVEVDITTGAVKQRVSVGTEPLGLAMSADGSELYVTLVQDAKLVAVNTASGKIRGSIATGAQPRAVTLTRQGKLLIAHLDQGLCLVDAAFDTQAACVFHLIPFRQGNPKDQHLFDSAGQNLTATRGVAVTSSPEGDSFAVHSQVSAGTVDDVRNFISQGQDGILRSETLSTGYYGSTVQTAGSGIAIELFPIEISITKVTEQGYQQATVPDWPVRDWHTNAPLEGRLDQPSDIAHHPYWSLAFVTGYGTDNVLVFNTAIDDPMRSPLAEVEVGMAPKGIALSPDGHTAYVMNEHAFTVSRFDVRPLYKMSPVSQAEAQVLGRPDLKGMFFKTAPPERAHMTRTLRIQASVEKPYATDPAPAEVRAGRRIFHYSRNAALTDGRRMACASCHFEGQDDHLVWLGKDGPRQTPSLAGRLHGTAPFKWTGTSEDLDASMIETTDRMGGLGMTPEDRKLLDAYLAYGLVEPPNPNLGAALTEKQARGKGTFDAQCASCHIGGGSDAKVHDVRTASDADHLIEEARLAVGDAGMQTPGFYNTPSLKGLFYSAPYLHDGSAATLEAVLVQTQGRMYKATLTDNERADLIDYLNTL
jgi:DNA-binding beta-propeller fold protein YncE